MAVLVECGSCGRKFRAKDQFRDKQIKCPGCGECLVIAGRRVPDHDVFVSYSNKDKTVADAVCAALEGKRLRCWIAPRDIGAGQKWGASIVNAIEDARAMVLVYSAHSNRSEQVHREVERAVAKGVPIVPFRIDDTPMCKEMEYFLSASHWLDALTEPLEEHVRKLVSMVRGLLSGQGAPAGAGVPAGPSAAGARRRLGRRTALLAGGVGLVVVAAVVLSVLLSGGGDGAGLDDVVPVKSQAEMAWEDVKDLDGAQGFEPLLRAGSAFHRQAAAFFEQKAYARAETNYRKLLEHTRMISDRQKLRSAAQASRAKAQAAEASARTAGAPAEAKAPWDTAAGAAAKAASEFERGAFAEAARAWETAAGRYAAARAHAEGRQRLAGARDAYEKALAEHDAARLSKYGGQVWDQIKRQLQLASDAGTGAPKAAAAYRRAIDLLPQAAGAARKAYLADLLARAKAAERTDAERAFLHVAEILKEDPKHTEALAMKARLGLYGPPWWLDKALAAASGLKDTEDEPTKSQAQCAIAYAQARVGDIDGAGRTAAVIGDASDRADAYVAIAGAEADAGRFEDARKTAAAIGDRIYRAAALREIAKACVEAGDLPGAEAIAVAITGWDGAKVDAYVAIALEHGRRKDTAAARKALAKALAIAGAEDPSSRLRMYIDIAEAQMKLGDQAAARKCVALAKAAKAEVEAARAELKDMAEAVHVTSKDLDFTGHEEAEFATILAIVGQVAEAKAIAAKMSSNKYAQQESAYSGIIRAQLGRGDIGGALATCKLLREIPDAGCLAVVEAQVKAGQLEAARQTAGRITGSPYLVGAAAGAIARAAAAKEDPREILQWIDAQPTVGVVFACCGVAEGLAAKRKAAGSRK